MKMAIRMTPSTRFSIRLLLMKPSIKPEITMGSKKNSTMESPTPMAMAMPTITF